jgi:hypothetical protein
MGRGVQSGAGVQGTGVLERPVSSKAKIRLDPLAVKHAGPGSTIGEFSGRLLAQGAAFRDQLASRATGKGDGRLRAELDGAYRYGPRPQRSQEVVTRPGSCLRARFGGSASGRPGGRDLAARRTVVAVKRLRPSGAGHRRTVHPVLAGEDLPAGAGITPPGGLDRHQMGVPVAAQKGVDAMRLFLGKHGASGSP